jgi:glycosyltransferase involved in cell wall biosynthesis
VTPSYNQAQFIEETIRSVLLQGYPNLEYIIIDGGSDDGSIHIVRKYEQWLSSWLSEPDGGQSEAINKGFSLATGDILTWLNSDDRLRPGALQAAVEYFLCHPGVGVVYGDYAKIDSEGNSIGKYRSPDFDFHHYVVRQYITQPAALFRREVWDQIGPLDTSLHYMMDRDLWLRAALRFSIAYFPFYMADVRLHDAAKTVAQTMNFLYEQERIFDQYFARPDLPADVRALESEARAANKFSMGRLYLSNQEHQMARHCFECAWQIYPLHPYKLILIPFWIDTVLKTNIGMPLFRLATRLKNWHEFSA